MGSEMTAAIYSPIRTKVDLAEQTDRRHRGRCQPLIKTAERVRTDHDTVVVRGRTVTDEETLTQLGPLPATEAVVEVRYDVIAEVARAH